MSDLISRQAAIKAIEDLQDCYNGFSDTYDKACLIGVIEGVPTIEAEPKHAYVIVDEDGNMECSNCGSSNCFDNYCGTCGAKLIGTRRDEVEE